MGKHWQGGGHPYVPPRVPDKTPRGSRKGVAATPRQSARRRESLEAQMDALAQREANLTAQIEGAVKMRASLAAERRRLIRVWLGIKKLEANDGERDAASI